MYCDVDIFKSGMIGEGVESGSVLVVKTHFINVSTYIIELVDSICRNGTDTPISLNKCNASELLNTDGMISDIQLAL